MTKTIKVRNFTPHEVNVSMYDADNTLDKMDNTYTVSFPSEGNARVSVKEELNGYNRTENFLHMPFFSEEFGEVEGLPNEEENTIYIVSRMVYNAMPERKDLVYPVGLIRDEEGKIIGCKGLSTPKMFKED